MTSNWLTSQFDTAGAGMDEDGLRNILIRAKDVALAMKDRAPAHDELPPPDRHFAVPHQLTYASVWNWYQKYYYSYFDESLIDNQQNSLAMRRDGFTQELMRHRQLPTISLPHMIEIDDPDDEDQVKVRREATRIMDAIPYFQRMKLNLTEAYFYGKYGSQLRWGVEKVGGKPRYLPVGHIPVNGDKFTWGYDGVPGIFIYKGAPEMNDPKVAKYIRYLDKGPALFFYEQNLRDKFIIHEFENMDTDYLWEAQKGLAVHGLGMRDHLYWTWVIRVQVISWMLDALERVGVNGMLYGFYQEGNAPAKEAMEKAIVHLISTNVAVFPRNMASGTGDVIEQIKPSEVGYDILFKIIEHFEGIMRRAFLGQDLSSKSSPTGLGSSASDNMSDRFEDVIVSDAASLGETLNRQLFRSILKYNFFEYRGKTIRGSELPFGMRYKLQVERRNVLELIDAAEKIVGMGGAVNLDDLRDRAGITAPKSSGNTVAMPGGQSGMMQNRGAVAAEKGAEDHPNDPGTNLTGKHPEQFSMSDIREMTGYFLNQFPADVVKGAWWNDSSPYPLWVSLDRSSDMGHESRLRAGLGVILGETRARVEVERNPLGLDWQRVGRDMAADPTPREAEHYAKVMELYGEVGEDCGDGVGGFKHKNTCWADGQWQDALANRNSGGAAASPTDRTGTPREGGGEKSGSPPAPAAPPSPDAAPGGGEPPVSPKNEGGGTDQLPSFGLSGGTGSPVEASPAADASGGDEGDDSSDQGPSWFSKSKFAGYEGELDEPKFAATAEKLLELGPDSARTVLMSLAGATAGSKSTMSLPPSFSDLRGKHGIVVDTHSKEYKTIRKIYRDEEGLKIENFQFEAEPEYMKSGIGLKVFGDQVESAVAMGAKKMETYAARVDSPDPRQKMVGYYVWPRYGYDGDVPAKQVAQAAKDGFPDVKRVSDLMKTPEGRDWWRENGDNIELEFDLAPGSHSMQVWDSYLTERKKAGYTGDIKKVSSSRKKKTPQVAAPL